MKLIRSIIRPSKFDDVKSALHAADVKALTVSEVHDHGPQNEHGFVWMGHEYARDDVVRFEIVLTVDDSDVDDIVAIILCAARTPGLADGYVAVLPVDHRYSVHTGYREVS